MTKRPHRRQFLHLAAGAAALPVWPRIARPQAYPSRPVRIVVGFPSGGVGDIVARLMGQWLSDRLGQQFIVENRPGAGSNIGTEMVVNAPPDGYTLLLASSANAVGANLYEKLNFNFIRDVAPVAGLAHVPLVMEVTSSVPIKTVPEFITYTKANPGKLNMASNGNGTVAHVAGELFKMMTGVDTLHVPYRGAGPALTDMLGGQVQVMFDNVPSSTGSASERVVVVTARARSLPDLMCSRGGPRW
jgi:tripartite-type tricarboxylate transporter receptor subunit TctC